MPARLVDVSYGVHLISTDPARIDLDVVHDDLSNESYWAAGRTYVTQRQANDHSALVVGAGLGTEVVRVIVEHPDVVDVQRQILATGDAHDLYRRFGFTAVPDPDRVMVRATP